MHEGEKAKWLRDGNVSMPFAEHISRITVVSSSKSKILRNVRETAIKRGNPMVIGGERQKTSFPIAVAK